MDSIINLINSLIIKFNSYAQSNQVIAGALSLWGLGVLSYFGRNIPSKIWQIIKKQTTTSMILISSSQAFHNFMFWFSRQGYVDKLRQLKISSGRWGDEEAIKTIGYGDHLFFYKYKPFKIHMEKVDNTHSERERDELTITVLGRSHGFFNILFQEIQKSLAASTGRLSVYKYDDDCWRKVTDQVKRNMNTVFLDTGIKERIICHINNFLENEGWYRSHGIPYHTGLLFYGVSGSGKTSMIKAIASLYEKDLYILSVADLNNINDAIMGLPDDIILLIEDIDSDSALHKREGGKSIKKKRGYSLLNLSEILNALDGIITIHGRILIATTNHIEKLDEALLRNGRFDLRQEFGYATQFIVEGFMKSFFPNFELPSDFRIKDDVSSADIQKIICDNLSEPENVVKRLWTNDG